MHRYTRRLSLTYRVHVIQASEHEKASLLEQFALVNGRRQAVETENRPLVERSIALNEEISGYSSQRQEAVVSLLARLLSFGNKGRS